MRTLQRKEEDGETLAAGSARLPQAQEIKTAEKPRELPPVLGSVRSWISLLFRLASSTLW